LAFAADAGLFATLGGEDVGVAGVGVAPAQIVLQLAGQDDVVGVVRRAEDEGAQHDTGASVFRDVNVYPTVVGAWQGDLPAGDHGRWHVFDNCSRLGLPPPDGRPVWRQVDGALLRLAAAPLTGRVDLRRLQAAGAAPDQERPWPGGPGRRPAEPPRSAVAVVALRWHRCGLRGGRTAHSLTGRWPLARCMTKA
jgi:hypothetical protein